jgi:hypothetical protein
VRESRIRILVLFAQYTDKLAYFDDWLDALCQYPGFDAVAVDIVPSGAKSQIRRVLADVEAVVMLHSTNGDTTAYAERHVPALAQRRVPLVTFVGNEVNLPGSTISGKRRLFEAIRPEWIATQLLEEAGRYLFDDLASRGVVSIPHALNAAVYRPRRALDDRPIDIGSRVAKYLPHLGDDDRNRIADAFVGIGRERELRTDISNERFNREGWANFLSLCKGTVTTEAGSWFIEKDDATVEAIRRYVRSDSSGILVGHDSNLLTLAQKLPRWLRPAVKKVVHVLGFRHETVVNEARPLDDIHARFFAGKPRAPVYGKAMSSRHFEAVGTKTCQIMFRGRFNDIFEADRHYLALDHDFANLDDILARFSDPRERQAIVEQALAHVMEAHTHAHRMRSLHDLLLSNSAGGPSGAAQTGRRAGQHG